MPNVFDLAKVKKLIHDERLSAIIVLDTNIVIRESNFVNWTMPISEPVLILSDVIILELEHVKNKSNAQLSAEKAIRNVNELVAQGTITNGIHVESVGWFISVPSPQEEQLKSELAQLESVAKVFGGSDTKLLLLAKECSQVIGVPTIFATGDKNLYNIVEMNGIPAYLCELPMTDLDKAMNRCFNAHTDWDNVLAVIQETTESGRLELVNSFHWFYEEGLGKLLKDKFPIQHTRGGFELDFIGFELLEPAHTVSDCRQLGLTYTSRLYARTQLIIRRTGEIKVQDLYLADIPMITQDGTFIINGAEQTLRIDPIINRSLEQSAIDRGLDTLKSTALKRMSRISLETVTPSGLIDTRPLVTAVNEFFGKLRF